MIGRPDDEVVPSQQTGSRVGGRLGGSARSAPSDFDAYWQQLLDELAALPPAAEVDPWRLRSTDFASGYAVRLTSLGPYRLFAYYSVPHGPGPFPVIYHAPHYASVVQAPPYEERRRHIVLSLCARGQRLADRPFAAAYPGLLTEGIDDHRRYIFRGIVADTIRGLDFLLARPEVDQQRLAIVGNDMALIGAAFRPTVSAVIMAGPLFYDAAAVIASTEAYPWAEISDYTRLYPQRQASVDKTLSYFDSLFFAPRVRASVYLPYEAPGSLFSADRLAPLAAALPGGATLAALTGRGYTDRCAQEAWLAQRLAD